MLLSQLLPGQYAWVTAIAGNGMVARRLPDFGLIAGTRIQCVLKSPHGNPAAYLIKGAIIALRNEDAESVAVILEQ